MLPRENYPQFQALTTTSIANVTTAKMHFGKPLAQPRTIMADKNLACRCAAAGLRDDGNGDDQKGAIRSGTRRVAGADRDEPRRPVQRRRYTQAAERPRRKLLKKQRHLPRLMITDKLASYGAAKRELMPSVEHRRHKGLNNRAENSYQPIQRRERRMKRFKSAGQAPRATKVRGAVVTRRCKSFLSRP